jgi:peptidoglycan hydrolase CwlO-like protein
MNNTLWTTLITSLTGIAALVIAVVAYRKVKPEATKLITDSALTAVNLANTQRDAMIIKMEKLEEEFKNQQKEVAKMGQELKILKEEVDRLRNGIHLLLTQIKSKGEVPFWEP